MGGLLGEIAARAESIVNHGSMESLAALFIVALLTEIGIPFPLLMDTVLFLIGYQLGDLWLQAAAVVLVLLAGRGSGTTTVYWFSRFLGPLLMAWFDLHLPVVRKGAERLSQLSGIRTYLDFAFPRHGGQREAARVEGVGIRAVFSLAMARMTPGMLTASSVASGAGRMHYLYFLIGVGLASVFVDGALITLGFLMGYWLLQLGVTPSPWLLLVGLVANLAILWSIPHFLLRHPHPQPVEVADNA